MKQVGEIIPQIGQTKTTKHLENFTLEEFGQAIRMLLGYVKNAPAIGSTDFKIWFRSIAKDFTFEEVKAGVYLLENHKGYLDLATLREYIKSTRPPRSTPALEHKSEPASKENTKKYIKELRKELDI